MHIRRKARRMALQALYEIDCSNHVVEEVILRRIDEDPLDSSTEQFLRNLITSVLSHKDGLDTIIHKHAPEWPVDQMALVDRNILRMAIYEITVEQETPLKVVINEAVELAKVYGSDSAPRFINGVLGTLVARQGVIIEDLPEVTDISQESQL